MSRFALWPTSPPIQWVQVALSLRVKQLKRDTEDLPLSNAEIKNLWEFTSTDLMLSWHGA